MQIESGMTKEDIQVALQNLYQVLTDKGFTDTATAINCAEDTLMNDEGYDWKDYIKEFWGRLRWINVLHY